MGNHHEIIQEAPINWWLISLNLVQLLAWIVAIWLGVRNLTERGVPAGYFQIASRYDGKLWVASYVKVVITNVGKSSLITLAVGRRTAENALQTDLMTFPEEKALIMSRPINSMETDFTLEPGESKILKLSVLPGESPETDLQVPLAIWFVQSRRKFWIFGSKKLVKKEFLIERLENMKPTLGK